MAIDFLSKKFYTFPELALRWSCEIEDIKQAVIDKVIIPSYFLNGDENLYDVYQLNFDVDGFELEHLHEMSQKAFGYHYLVYPIQTDVSKCVFNFFNNRPEDVKEFDIVYRLKTPIELEQVLKYGVVMSEVVEKLESHKKKEPTDKPLTTTERNSMLKMILGMAIVRYKYDPKVLKNDATNKITNDLVSLGLEITDDTVRKYLKRATNEVLPHKPNP
jgi:hypothetical protein